MAPVYYPNRTLDKKVFHKFQMGKYIIDYQSSYFLGRNHEEKVAMDTCSYNRISD